MRRGLDREARRRALEALLRSRRALGAATLPLSSQPLWYIDAQAGNDSNSGLLGSPIQTWAEYLNRTGFEQDFDGISVDVYCTGVFPDSDPITKRARSTGFNSHYGIHGTLGSQLPVGATMTNFTASVPSTNTRASFTVTNGLTAAMKGCLVFFPVSNVYSQITSVNVGTQTATCLDPTTASSNGISTRVTPANTEPIIIYRGASARMLVEWLETTSLVGPGNFNGPFVLEGFSTRGTAALLKHIGNDNVISPLVQFMQFQDLDLVADGSLFKRHCSISVNGETTLRNRFDSTQGGYFVTGNAIIAADGALFPNCQMEGVELGTYGNSGNNCVNELSGNINYQIEGFAAFGSRLGFWTTGGGKLTFVDIREAEFGTGEVFGVCSAAAALNIGRNASISYQSNGSFHCYAVGSTTQLSFVRGSGANAWPALAANGSQPAQAACTSFADVVAAPFNGKAYDPTSGGLIIPL